MEVPWQPWPSGGVGLSKEMSLNRAKNKIFQKEKVGGVLQGEVTAQAEVQQGGLIECEGLGQG